MTRDLSKNPLFRYHDSDVGNAEMFVDHFAGRILAQDAPNSSKWSLFVFNRTTSWVEYRGRDQTSLVKRAVFEPLKAALAELRAAAADDEDDFDAEKSSWTAWSARVKAAGSARGMANTAEVAYSQIPKVRKGDFDQQTWLIGCGGGVLDLAEADPEKRWREAKPEDMVLWQLPVTYDPGARSPEWTAFKRAIFGDYLEHWNRIEGMYLVGQLLDAVFAIVVTQGGVGKGTLANVYGSMLGDFATPAAKGYFTKEGQGKHSTDAADLQNRRALLPSEVNPDEELNPERVLQDTGGDPRKTRGIGMDQSDAEEWTPQFVPTYFTNHMPKLGGEFVALDRRLHLFDMEPDRATARKFQAEIQRIMGGDSAERTRFLEGVLAEAVENAHSVFQLYGAESHVEMWFSKQRPAPMVKAVHDAIGAADPFLIWWERRVVEDPTCTEKLWVVDGTTKDALGNPKEPDEPLWRDYSAWYLGPWKDERKEAGLDRGPKLSPNQFWTRLSDKGFPGVKGKMPTARGRKDRSYRVGLRLAEG